jgi:hypothetical protein
MADNNYPIAPLFPKGLLLDLLIQEMPTVWPADLFPAGYTTNGPPRGTQTSGALTITTPRDLTSDENTDALNQFAVHDPDDGVPVGLTMATLPDPSPAGQVQYVRDLARATGPDVGTMAYSNGIEWRRFSDDALI